MSGKKKLIIGAVGVVIVIALVGLNASRSDGTTAVRLETVDHRSLVATVTASGQIEPTRKVDISADITGRIIELPVEEGDWVGRGDLLVRIDPSQYEAGVARSRAALSSAQASALQARANRDQARRELDRSQALRETDSTLVSQVQLETAQTSYEVAAAIATSAEHQVEQARAGLQEAQEQLAKTILRAPMAGQVTRLAVEEGEVAVPGTFSRETGLLLTVSDLSVIQVNVRVDETDVVRLHMGDSTDVEIDAYPDTVFSGRVTKIAQSAVRVAAAGSGGDQAVDYDVEITLDNPPPDIRPDLSATAKIITATRDSALSIPIIALTVREHTPISTETAPADTTTAEVEGVFVVVDGVAQFRPVDVGIAGEEHFEVLAGLSRGDTIVAGPYQTIRDLSDSTHVRAMPGSPILESTSSGDQATVSGTDQAAAAEQPEDEAGEFGSTLETPAQADSLFYSVQVAALGGLESALEYATQFESVAPATVSAIVRGQNRILYRVMVGALPSEASAADLRQRLRADGFLAGADGIVVRTPHALRIGRRPNATSGAQAVRSLRAAGIPAYMLSQPDGSALLLVGAFETPDQAQLNDSVLPASEESRSVVSRSGVARSE
ncbi:MAG: efflux RND transporter periplasmic adaptor subunit [Gemmatimonadota bacterium]|nr:MAG: efflux RND transporter periplasmic adaptor subunit [Gemmatimonadota bacterium]